MTTQAATFEQRTMELLNGVTQVSNQKTNTKKLTMEQAISTHEAAGHVVFRANKIDAYLNDDGKLKKNIVGCPPGWAKLDVQTAKNHHDHGNVLCLATGKKSNISVLDFDDAVSYELVCDQYPKLKSHHTVKTNRGYHVYFNYDSNFKSSSNVFTGMYPGVDTRNDGGFVYAEPTQYRLPDGSLAGYEFIGGTMQDFPPQLFEFFKQERLNNVPAWLEAAPIYKEEPVAEPTKNDVENTDIDKLRRACDIISVEYLTGHADWRKIMWALKKEGIDKAFAVRISKKAGNYTDSGFNLVWERAPATISIGAGTIFYYAKQSDSKKFFEIMDYPSKYSLTGKSDKVVAELLIEQFGDDFVAVREGKGFAIYTWFNDMWHYDADHMLQNKIMYFATELFSGCITNEQKLLVTDSNNSEKHAKNINGLVKGLEKYSNITGISTCCSLLKNMLSINCIQDDFDTQLPNVVRFTNTAFDVITGKEFTIEKHHHITQSTGYDYVEPSKDQLDLMHDLWKDVFPNAEHHDCYMSIIKQALTGNRLEKFYMANGVGRNGKGFINELVMAALGSQYSLKGNIGALCQPIKGGANQEIAELDKKRFVVFNEPNDGIDKLQLGNIKSLTGDGEVNSRGLYSTKTSVKIQASIIFECNKKPAINGKIEEAVIARFVNIYFKTYFTDNAEDLEVMEHAKPQRQELKSDAFKKEYRCALFKYIMDNARSTLFVPKDLQAETKEYLMDNDEFLSWFNENYEECPGNIIKIRALYNHFKMSAYYQDMNKAQRRILNEKNFKADKIQTNIKLRNHYHEIKKIDQKQHKNFLLGYKLRIFYVEDENGEKILDSEGNPMPL